MSGVPVVDISNPPRRPVPPASSAPILPSPILDPSSGTHQETVAYLSEVARAVNQLQDQVATLTGRVVGVETNQ
eukprot:10163527-Alexandrium_andersonii.AAC.1